MSEPINKPYQELDKYNPKETMTIRTTAENAKDVTTVMQDDNLTFIDGVPQIGWDIPWRYCTYSGCMTLLLNTMGANTTYEQVMGISGSCFRTSMAYGWDAGSNIVNITYYFLQLDASNVYRTYGKVFTDINKTDTDEFERLTRDSIDMGIPVMVMSGRGAPEWGVILGYEQTVDGYKYFGRSYFDSNAPENELFTKNQYALMSNFPNNVDSVSICKGSCEPITALDSLKHSLETCIKMSTPHEKFGFGAYDKMINDFVNNHFQTEWNSEGDVYTILVNLTDARRAAHIYLSNCYAELTDEKRSQLEIVASFYKDIFEVLNSMKAENDFDKKMIMESAEIRNRYIEILRKCKNWEYQAHGIIKDILSNWD